MHRNLDLPQFGVWERSPHVAGSISDLVPWRPKQGPVWERVTRRRRAGAFPLHPVRRSEKQATTKTLHSPPPRGHTAIFTGAFVCARGVFWRLAGSSSILPRDGPCLRETGAGGEGVPQLFSSAVFETFGTTLRALPPAGSLPLRLTAASIENPFFAASMAHRRATRRILKGWESRRNTS